VLQVVEQTTGLGHIREHDASGRLQPDLQVPVVAAYSDKAGTQTRTHPATVTRIGRRRRPSSTGLAADVIRSGCPDSRYV